MNVGQIAVNADEAEALIEQYQALAKERRTANDDQILRALRALKKHFAIVDIDRAFALAGVDATGAEIAAFLLGGPFGIVSAMWIHPRLARRR